MAKRTLTPEQAGICAVKLQPGGVLVIEAFAGTGKTSTLEEFTAANPDLRFVYMAYNATAAADAAKRFPAHVKCRTGHSLAFAETGKIYKEKLGEPRAKTIMGPLSISTPVMANHVIETLSTYLRGADVTLDESHMPPYLRADSEFPEEQKKEVMAKAKKLWAAMCDPQNKEIPMSHDGYLKLWQVRAAESGTLPNAFRSCDVVLLDEAQDTNPTMEFIVRQLIEGGNHRIVVVGDSRQNIYSFRGSVNVMQRMRDDIRKKNVPGEVHKLTTSFRYPADVAKTATLILNADASPENRVTVNGLRDPNDKRIESEAIVGRSNGGIIGSAIEYMQRNPRKKIHFAATTLRENWNPTTLYKFDEIMGVYLHSIRRGSDGRSPYIKQFKDYAEIVQYAKGDEQGRGGDKELDACVRVVEKYGSQLPDLLSMIVSRCGPPEGVMSFSTAHRSKGLEWDKVTLLEDFDKVCKMTAFLNEARKSERPSRDELNLLYVAATRPRKTLVMNPDLRVYVQERSGNIQKPEDLMALASETVEPKQALQEEVQITEDDFIDYFKPEFAEGNSYYRERDLSNPKDVDMIAKAEKENRLWTMVEDDSVDGEPLLLSGFHREKRLYYIITEVPHKSHQAITVLGEEIEEEEVFDEMPDLDMPELDLAEEPDSPSQTNGELQSGGMRV